MTTSTDGYPIVAAASLAQSLRDSGYKSPASAGAELGDNSFQAGANIFCAIIQEGVKGTITDKEKRRTQSKYIERVVFSDDGKGMDPELLRNAVRFGYSPRFNDRQGMGRFGMGLPNASISQAKTFSVYSKTINGEWHCVSLNLDEIAQERVKEVPTPTRQVPPQDYVVGDGTSGTIVIWEDLDRLNMRYSSASNLQTHFVTEFSRIFRYFLVAGRTILINTSKGLVKVEPFDPLYLMNEAQYSGATLHGDVIAINVVKDDGSVEKVEVRFSLTPVEWQVSPEGNANKPNAEENLKRRLHKNRGISFVRANREIDFTPADGLKGSHPVNMWWSAEVSFPPSLDEQFGIEFTKQRVVLTDSIRNMLADKAFNPNVVTLLSLINMRRPKDEPIISSAPAEEIAARVQGKLREVTETPKDKEIPPEKVEERTQKSAQKRRRVDETTEEAKRRIQRLPFLVEPEDRPGAPFYRIETHGSQTYVCLNTHHTFYEKVYVPLEVIGGNALTGIQLLLFALAQGQAQAGLDVKEWYEDEIFKWSGMLTTFLREMPEQKTPQILTEEPTEDM